MAGRNRGFGSCMGQRGLFGGGDMDTSAGRRNGPWRKGFLVLGEQKGQRPWGGFTLEMFQEMQGGPMAGGG